MFCFAFYLPIFRNLHFHISRSSQPEGKKCKAKCWAGQPCVLQDLNASLLYFVSQWTAPPFPPWGQTWKTLSCTIPSPQALLDNLIRSCVCWLTHLLPWCTFLSFLGRIPLITTWLPALPPQCRKAAFPILNYHLLPKLWRDVASTVDSYEVTSSWLFLMNNTPDLGLLTHGIPQPNPWVILAQSGW